jgi:hypothetical protein
MFSVKTLMEEGYKFIIPPPKYHPYSNPLPVPDPSFVLEKMAAESPYHRLPENDAPRPSMDTIPGDDHRLLDTESLYDHGSPPPPNAGLYKFKLSYHPTFYLRLLVLCLFISAFGIFVGSRRSHAIPATIFLSFAILRNILVLYSHLVRRCFIRIHIEIIGRASSVNSKPKKWRPTWLEQRSVQILIDWVLIVILLITTITAQKGEAHYYTWRYHWRNGLVLPGCVLCWIALVSFKTWFLLSISADSTHSPFMPCLLSTWESLADFSS